MVLLALFILTTDSSGQSASFMKKQAKGKPAPFQSPSNLPPAPKAAGTPPPGPVHCCAEWEESEGIMTLWWNEDLIDKLQVNNLVYIPVDNANERRNWESFLTGNGIPLTNIHFLYIKTNSIYTRDYGPWFIWDANNEMGIVNYTCHYGFHDDLFPQHFASLYGINFYESGLNHVGGNYLPNGYDIAFSSTYVYMENLSSTKEAVDTAMNEYYGLDPYRTIAPQTIWHHDTWGKPCNPETLIVVDFPKNDAYSHKAANDTVAFYETLQSPWGGPYKIFRLPMFVKSYAYRPYMNTLVSNKEVFVPVDNVPDDQIALGVFEQAFPGYDVVGVDSKGCLSFDALHCRTRNFVKRDPIRIYPYPPRDTEETAADYPVTAEVIPPNGYALEPGYPVIHWSDTGGAPFNNVVMNPTGQPDEYAGDIPAQALGTTVSFYIEAQDDGGRTAIYPLVAPDGMMSFAVREDTEAPVLSRFIPTRSASAGQWPPLIRTLCKDDMATPEVSVEYSINGVPQADTELTREELCYWYSGFLGGNASAGDLVTYRIKGMDNADSAHTSYLPMMGEIYCPVAAPEECVAVVNLCGRPYTAPFLLDALGDLGIPCVSYTEWPADFDEHDVWFICLGVFADNHVLTPNEASDIVAALQAGKNICLEGGDTWCYDPEKDTLNPWFGVQEISRGPSTSYIIGASGSIMDGLNMFFTGENGVMDVISNTRPAEMLFDSPSDKGRAVLLDAGGYRTIASSFSLGGLLDKEWPSIRKEVLIRYLGFLGVDEIQLTAAVGAALHGTRVPVRLEAEPGHEYIVFASLTENYLATGFGVFRLGFSHLFNVGQGVVPPSGLVELNLLIPHNNDFVGLEIHLQAVTGETLAPAKANLTNREILTVVD